MRPEGCGCSPIKTERELGLDRCETGWFQSIGAVWVSEGKMKPVREERFVVANGVPIVREGTVG